MDCSFSWSEKKYRKTLRQSRIIDADAGSKTMDLLATSSIHVHPLGDLAKIKDAEISITK
jgi:hypothetical protein